MLAPATRDGTAPLVEYFSPVVRQVLSESQQGLVDGLTASDHDVFQLGVNLLWGPLQAGRVLSHLETGHGYTTSVGSLAGGVVADTRCLGGGSGGGTGRLEDINSLLGAAPGNQQCYSLQAYMLDPSAMYRTPALIKALASSSETSF
jgi:hypothetical protein